MKTITLALLGFGTVGRGVWNLLEKNGAQIADAHDLEFKIKKILVPNLTKDRGIKEAEGLFTTDFSEIENDKEIDIVIEVIGKHPSTLDYMMRSLKSGKHLVSANKHLLAREGSKLFETAEKAGKKIRFEASVCGAIPIVDLTTKSLSPNRIDRIMGIMNGTSNFILSKMAAENSSYDEVLKEAQRLGYAESDPTDDVKGMDAANKILILSSIAFHSKFDIEKVGMCGIDEITREDFERAAEQGCTIKLIASGERTEEGVKISVRPCFVKKTHPLASVGDAFNAVFVDTDCAGEMTFVGRGAGSLPTASAVIADCIDIAIHSENGDSFAYARRIREGFKQVDTTKMESGFPVIE